METTWDQLHFPPYESLFGSHHSVLNSVTVTNICPVRRIQSAPHKNHQINSLSASVRFTFWWTERSWVKIYTSLLEPAPSTHHSNVFVMQPSSCSHPNYLPLDIIWILWGSHSRGPRDPIVNKQHHFPYDCHMYGQYESGARTDPPRTRCVGVESDWLSSISLGQL